MTRQTVLSDGASTTAAESTASTEAVAPAAVPRAGGRPLRADARRNYDALIEAAARAFAEQGVDAPLEDVAKTAGVGIGTLYRHFPARPALILAVYEREVQQLCDAAPVLLRDHPDAPDVALAEWMQRFVGYVATKRGLAGALRAQHAVDTDHFAALQVLIRAALGSLVEAAAADGRIRSDVDTADLLNAVRGVCMATDDGWLDRTRRMVALLLDGLKYGAPNPR